MKRVMIALLVVLFAGGGLYVAGLVRGSGSATPAVVPASAPAATDGASSVTTAPATASTQVTTAATTTAAPSGATVAPSEATAAPTGATAAPPGATAATPSATAAPSTTPEPSPSPTPVPLSLVTPLPVSTAEPAPSGPVNYADFGRGAIVRRWTAAASSDWPGGIVTKNGWRPKTDGPGPYEFVVEFPEPTTIARLGVEGSQHGPHYANLEAPAKSDTSATPTPTVTVTFATSAQSADGPFSDAATVPLGFDDTEQTAPSTTTGAIRWLRIRVSEPPGVTLSRLDRVAAYGTQIALPNIDLAGPWYSSSLNSSDPWIDIVHGKLLTVPDAAKLKGLDTARWYTLRRGAVTQFARCADGTESSVMAAFDDGSHRLIANRGGQRDVLAPISGDAIADLEGDVSPSVMFRMKGPRACKTLDPAGTGKTRVAVLTREDSYSAAYVPPDDLKDFPGYRFEPIFSPLLDPAVLAHDEIAVLASSCSIGLELQPWQTAGLLEYVKSGHKLIIHDADTCRSPNYSFLPYPTALSAAGAEGKASNILDLIESDPLGTDKGDPKKYIDTDTWIADKTQQIGDGDVIYSDDPHWCGHLLTTNALGVSGYVQAYAHYGKGLIIYDGLDHDNRQIAAFIRLMQLELAIPLGAKLPCTHPTGGFVLDPGHTLREYVPGKSQRIAVGLSGVAILSFTGTINLAAAGPFATTLSTHSVSLKASRVPFGVLVDVPANARGGAHHFVIHGDDGAGHTSDATIDLVPGKTSALERTLQSTGRVTLHNILFDTASAKLRPASYAVLGQIADALGRNPKWRLRVDGHTDNVGGADYNLDLSQRRAASVKSALVKEFHVDAKRLRTAGYGLTKPVASNGNDAGRQLNRRVELVRF